MIEPDRRPVAQVARRLGCTEGQVFTMLIGLCVALLLAIPGIPAVLRDRPAREGPAVALRPFAGSAAASPALGGPPTASGSEPASGPSRWGGTDAAAPLVSSPRHLASPPSGAATPTPAPGTMGVFARVGQPGAPGGLAVATDGTVFVTTDNGTARGGTGPSRAFSYDVDGSRIADRAILGQSDDRVGGLTGAAVHPASGRLAVLDPEGARIVSIDMRADAQSVLAKIPDLPPCLVSLGACQHGFEDRKPHPVSAVYDQHGNLFFTDPAQDTIWRLRAGASAPEVWYQSVNFSAGDGPFGLAIHGASVEFTVGTSNDLSALGAGALYRLTINPDGSAGGLTLRHAFEQGDRPGALAVGLTGTAYVVLRDSGAIVTLSPDGSQVARLDPPGGGPIPLDAPSAVALVPGALLVANGRTSDDPDRWAVLTMAVDDGPTMTPGANDDRLRTRQHGKVA